MGLRWKKLKFAKLGFWGILLLFLVILIVTFYLLGQINIYRKSFNISSDSGSTIITNTIDKQEHAKVIKVIDGDTIKLENGETVRYLGMDAPEIYEFDSKTNKWDKTDKCYSQEAMLKNKQLVEGKVVRLEKDISEKDKYGRLLRYVWVPCHPEFSSGSVLESPKTTEEILKQVQNDKSCNELVNMKLVKGGFATAMTVPPDNRYEQEILQAEQEAKAGKRGLWEACK